MAGQLSTLTHPWGRRILSLWIRRSSDATAPRPSALRAGHHESPLPCSPALLTLTRSVVAARAGDTAATEDEIAMARRIQKRAFIPGASLIASPAARAGPLTSQNEPYVTSCSSPGRSSPAALTGYIN